MYKKIYLKKGHDRRIRNGHLWVFNNELSEIPQLEMGSIIELFDSNNKSYGYGFYHPNSLISVRLLNYYLEINIDFFIDRLNSALNLRYSLFKPDEMIRIVFGESDLLPGLIIDKFGDYLAIQSLSAGIEKKIDMILSAILHLLPQTKGIILKNKSLHRINEGLELHEKIIFGNIPEEVICSENGLKFSISLSESQKTGYYLDQKENRLFLKRISSGKTILDCYTNQGGFALNAALGGAKDVFAVDVSKAAIEKVNINANLNGFNNIHTICSDVPEFLESEIEKEKKFDIVILDPPSFTKSKKNINTAIAGYKKINKLAMKLITEGGYLVSSSCTHHLKEELFEELIGFEANKAGKKLQIVYRGTQAADHPILVNMQETKYLKFMVFRIQ